MSYFRYSVKKDILKNVVKLIGKHLCRSFFFKKVAGWPATLLKRDSDTGALFCELWEFFKNNYFADHLQKASFIIPHFSKSKFSLSSEKWQKKELCTFLRIIVRPIRLSQDFFDFSQSSCLTIVTHSSFCLWNFSR